MVKVATRPEQFTSGNLRKEENVLFLNFRFTEPGAIQLPKPQPRMNTDESFNENGAIQLGK
jgi:hypothetical protein